LLKPRIAPVLNVRVFCCETAWKERPRGFERAAAELVNTYRGIRSRNHAAMRFARIFFRRESVFGVGVTPEYQVDVDSLR
jgi:hypothetical protein